MKIFDNQKSNKAKYLRIAGKIALSFSIIAITSLLVWRLYPTKKSSATNDAATPAVSSPTPANTQASENQDKSAVAGATTNQPANNAVKLIAIGDLLPLEVLNNRAKNGNNYDYLQFMTRMKPFFDKADLKFCNQAVVGGGDQFGISGYPVFNSPTAVARDLSKLGCNIINTGTNYSNDKGQPAIDASLAVWDTIQSVVAVAGANRNAEEHDKVRYFEDKGINFAFVSYSTNTNKPAPNPFSLSMYNKEFAQKQISEARSKADIVIVSMRWGTEYSSDINSSQDNIAKELADMGADIVFGHGPHVIQPVKRLTGKDGRETLVWFSLGNFLNAQLEVEDLVSCIASIEIDPATKKVSRANCLPIFSSYSWSAAEKKSGNLLARKDFAMMPLEEAASSIPNLQLNTTIEVQTSRINGILNKFTEIPVIKVTEF